MSGSTMRAMATQSADCTFPLTTQLCPQASLMRSILLIDASQYWPHMAEQSAHQQQ